MKVQVTVRQHSKFDYQDALYEFPYHYLPSLADGRLFRLHRQLSWGLEYMTYMSFTVDLIERLRPESLCDVGCGDGRLIQLVSPVVPEITGIDVSERAIAFARAFNPEAKIVCGNVADLKRRYRMVSLIEVMEHIPDSEMQSFIQSVAGLVDSEGFLYLTVPSVNTPLNKKHYRHYTLELVQDTIGASFVIENHWWLYRRTILERLLTKLLVNRFFLLNFGPAMRLLWSTHKRFTYMATGSTGAHLAVLARPKHVLLTDAA